MYLCIYHNKEKFMIAMANYYVASKGVSIIDEPDFFLWPFCLLAF